MHFEKFIKIKDGHTVNFRSEPKVTSSNIIGTLKAGTILQALADPVGTFVQAKNLTNGQVGYVSTSIDLVSDYEPSWLVKTKSVVEVAEKYLLDSIRHPYEFSSSRTNNKTFDCSDLSQWCYDEALEIDIPWDSRKQSVFGTEVGTNYDELRTGDLIFFDTNGDGIVNHVAIYVYPNKIIHTYSKTSKVYDRDMNLLYASGGGVTYSKYEDGTSWRKNTTGARRIVNE